MTKVWYKEELIYNNAPFGSKTEIIGIFDPQGQNIISIILRHGTSTSSASEILLYSHNPSMLRQEEPSKEDIHDRYVAKVNKFRNKYSEYENVIHAFRNNQKTQE